MKRSSALRIWFAAVALALYVAFVLVVTLTPSPVDLSFRDDLVSLLDKLHERGLPGLIDYRFVEFSSNIALFVPLGFIASLLLPRRGWWLVLLIGPVFSSAIEFAQQTFLPARYATVSDVVANSIGAPLGAVLAVLLRLLVSWRDRYIVEQILAESGSKPALAQRSDSNPDL